MHTYHLSVEHSQGLLKDGVRGSKPLIEFFFLHIFVYILELRRERERSDRSAVLVPPLGAFIRAGECVEKCAAHLIGIN